MSFFVLEVFPMYFETTKVESQENIIQQLKVKLRNAQKLICKKKKQYLS